MSPQPTTTKPITAPLEKATLRPEFRLSLAALAVRLDEFVATVIPINPASPDNKPPERKANGTKITRNLLTAKTTKIKKTIMKKIETVVFLLMLFAV